MAYVGRQVDRRGSKVNLGDIERLAQEIRGVELVEGSGASLSHWHGSRLLSSHVHACDALRDAGDTLTDLSTLVGSRIATIARLGRAVLRLLLGVLISAGWLLGLLRLLLLLLHVGLGIAPVLRRGRRAALHLAADAGIGAGRNVKGASSVPTLLLLGRGASVDGRSAGLLILRLVLELAVALSAWRG